MRPSDLIHLRQPSDPRISPDGMTVAFVVATPNLDEDRYDRRIWLADETGVRPVSDGPYDTHPRWSPDGAHLAFLRQTDADSKPQVNVVELASEEVTAHTDFDLGVEEFDWSPDGSRLVVTAVTYTEEWRDLDTEERERKPKRITRIPFMFDNKGAIHDRRRHLWIVDVRGQSSPSCITESDFDETLPAWSPDGTTIAYITDRDPGQGLAAGNDVFEVDVATGETRQAFERGFWQFVSYRPDGLLHALGNTDPRYPGNAYLVRREGDGSLTNLTQDLDRSSVSLAAGPAALVWTDSVAVTGIEDSGAFGVIAVETDGTVRTLVDGRQVVTGFDVSEDRVVTTSNRWDSPGEVYSNGEPLTALNDDLGLIEPSHFRVSSDGYQVDVWVYLPPGEEKVPLLLNVHGGPASQYGFGFFDEFHVYSRGGYGVVACNPRGSSGRGVEYVEAVKADGWGVVDLADIRAAVAGAVERFERLDTDRMGVMGGSYGGFMTAWITANEDRWDSAVVERALLSWTSFNGTSDIAGVFAENYLLQEYPASWETLWAKSPLAFADRVTTPTLVLHSEDDYRCPIEQAEQYFTALLRNGTPAEMLRFPGEGHEMSRSGKPRHRVERFEAILDWHSRYLA